MSEGLVAQEVERFLRDPKPGVLCLRGKWGVGKTYAWRRALEQAIKANSVDYDQSAYVSLFGISSLDDLKYAIFENTVPIATANEPVTSETFELTLQSLQKSWRKLTWLSSVLPYFRQAAPALNRATFLSVNKRLICFDDIERRSQKLDLGEFLGLVSFLKEQRRCKVAIILNDQALKDGDLKQFESYLEKVAEISLVYEPTAEEAANIALPSDLVAREILIQSCMDLDLRNIRLIERIGRLAKRLGNSLCNYDEEVVRSAMRTLTLLCWSIFQPDDAPSLDYIVKARGSELVQFLRKEPVDEKEAKWLRILRAYGFGNMDELDSEILEGIKRGFFNASSVSRSGADLHGNVLSHKRNKRYLQAWRSITGNFTKTGTEVVDELLDATLYNLNSVSAGDLNQIILLLKAVGRPDDVTRLLSAYSIAFDGRQIPVYDTLSADAGDPDVWVALSNIKAKTTSFPDRADSLRAIGLNATHFSERHLEVAGSASAEELHDIIMKLDETELMAIIRAWLSYGRMGNVDQRLKTLTATTERTLRKLALESPLNAYRAHLLGVRVQQS